jgi:flagellar FliJ protein
MPRFVFQLESVLQHRERIEEDRQRDLARLLAELVQSEREFEAFDQQVQETTCDVRQHHMVGRLDMNYLAAHRRYMIAMQRKGMMLAQKIEQQRQLVETARRALAEASKDKKILEKLKERRHRQWLATVARSEANALDELTTQMSFRNLQTAEDA